MAFHSTRVRSRALLIAALFLPFIVGIPAVQAADGVTLETHPLNVRPADESGPGAYESGAVNATFTMFGLTWRGAGPAEAWYRVGEGDLAWSSWRRFEAEAVDGPDPDTGESGNSGGGTDPVYVGLNERIQFRFSGDVPATSRRCSSTPPLPREREASRSSSNSLPRRTDPCRHSRRSVHAPTGIQPISAHRGDP